MKEGVQISEEAIKLLARGAKNLAALLYALAKDQKKLYGKVNMNRLLSEQRPIEVLPLRKEDFDEFKRRAKKVGLLFSTILDKKGDEPYLEILTNIDHLSQANYILEQMGYQAQTVGGRAAKKRADPCPTRTILAKAKELLNAGGRLSLILGEIGNSA
ncbi:MAG: PcfB family protein [Oscillospiraceae bacterium]